MTNGTPAAAPAVVVQPQPGGGTVTTVTGGDGHGTITSIAGGMVDAVKALPPVLLLIVLLNMAFAGVGGWYLLAVEGYRAEDRKELAQLLTKCIAESVPVDFLLRQQQPQGR